VIGKLIYSTQAIMIMKTGYTMRRARLNTVEFFRLAPQLLNLGSATIDHYRTLFNHLIKGNRSAICYMKWRVSRCRIIKPGGAIQA
jgi:hypothetical protein